MRSAGAKVAMSSVAIPTAIIAMFFLVSYQPSAQAAAKAKGEIQIDLFVTGMTPSEAIARIKKGTTGTTFQVDSFFDITYSNIGSSGLDGVRASSFNVDSFFDITYEISFDSSTGFWDTEMVSMSLSGSVDDPNDPAAMENALAAVRKALNSDEFYGHVTVLK